VFVAGTTLALLASSASALAYSRQAAVVTSQVDPQVQAGAAAIQQHACGACHTIPGIQGAQGKLAPDLGPHDDVPEVASRSMIATYPQGVVPNNSRDDMVAWILDPASLKPGTVQPNLGLSPEEAAAVAAYLYAIQPDGSVPGMGDAGGG
jgi:cytochrome c1